ncbi:GNAT family N-acetyltransferase [Vibrio sp. CUB2]|uniref:GNAT family N-acetyltransferase n=1 Tax=Vibrio sp. CUB2 TaxID=2315233 RepID=UPI000769B334|nr:GNAT family N-acetyltransferase [Vibrio sp. CUB2]
MITADLIAFLNSHTHTHRIEFLEVVGNEKLVQDIIMDSIYLYTVSRKDEFKLWMKKINEKGLNNRRSHLFFKINDSIAGYMSVDINSTYLNSLYIRRNHQNHGYGSLILEMVDLYFNGNLKLHSDADMSQVIEFYRKNSFEIIDYDKDKNMYLMKSIKIHGRYIS